VGRKSNAKKQKQKSLSANKFDKNRKKNENQQRHPLYVWTRRFFIMLIPISFISLFLIPDHLVYQQILFNVAIGSFMGVLTISLISPVFKKDEPWFIRIGGGGLFLLFCGCLIVLSTDTIQLILDIDDYEAEKFEEEIGYIEEPEIHTSKGESYGDLVEFQINGITINADKLYISEPQFEEEINGRKVKIVYLPNSKLAVDWEYSESM
jgi:hypothetical protein